MKKLPLYIFLVLMFCNVGYAAGDLFYKDYKKFSEEEQVIRYLQTLETGMSWAQTAYKQKGVKKLYCNTKTITHESLVMAIDLALKDFESRGHSSEDIDGYPMGVVFMVGLPILFPCN